MNLSILQLWNTVSLQIPCARTIVGASSDKNFWLMRDNSAIHWLLPLYLNRSIKSYKLIPVQTHNYLYYCVKYLKTFTKLSFNYAPVSSSDRLKHLSQTLTASQPQPRSGTGLRFDVHLSQKPWPHARQWWIGNSGPNICLQLWQFYTTRAKQHVLEHYNFMIVTWLKQTSK